MWELTPLTAILSDKPIFTIDAEGRVTDLKVSPPIADKGYARRFDDAMRNYRFKPARDPEGKAVPGVLPFTVTF